jgi:hypothetical protein
MSTTTGTRAEVRNPSWNLVSRTHRGSGSKKRHQIDWRLFFTYRSVVINPHEGPKVPELRQWGVRIVVQIC